LPSPKVRTVDASCVARATAALEARIGVRLFQRSTRSIKLTEAGAHYLAKVVPRVDEIERVEAEVRGLRSSPRGTLRLTASVSFALRGVGKLSIDLACCCTA